MRIIAGTHRGRPILPPPSDATRPITDRVKQSLFDILAPYLEGARIYDIFAGTGSMGLECLSRGSAHATFFEADRGALANLKKNIVTLKLNDQATIVPGDLFQWFNTQKSEDRSKKPEDRSQKPEDRRPKSEADVQRSAFNVQRFPSSGENSHPAPAIHLAFLDPPYRYLREQPAALRQLALNLTHHLAPDGIIIFRHDSADSLDLLPYRPIDTRTYGSMTLEFLRADATEE